MLRYGGGMSDLSIDLYVALRTAPRTVKKRYALSRTSMEGDEGTREMVDVVMKILERYNIEPKAPPHAGPKFY